MKRTMDFLSLFEACRLCPRECGVNRLEETEAAPSGFCGETSRLRVAYVGPHFGEEPPISGSRGSGTIFFSGCSLRCSYCQNIQISRHGLGMAMEPNELLGRVEKMIRADSIHNINLVTPDHFFPHAFRMVSSLRERGHRLPIVFNLSGYQSATMLGIAEDYADIYLPDFKYMDPGLSMRLSRCKDYAEVALQALAEMVRQKGFLDSSETGAPLAKRGVLVRHLILPGRVENSLNALTTLFLEFGARLPLSLMSQYTPVLAHQDKDLNRSLAREEFDRVYSHALDLGFHCLFVQFPNDSSLAGSGASPFLPDFSRTAPFSGPGKPGKGLPHP
jgi:putative pyruvate formate lyase activating enzyme